MVNFLRHKKEHAAMEQYPIQQHMLASLFKRNGVENDALRIGSTASDSRADESVVSSNSLVITKSSDLTDTGEQGTLAKTPPDTPDGSDSDIASPIHGKINLPTPRRLDNDSISDLSFEPLGLLSASLDPPGRRANGRGIEKAFSFGGKQKSDSQDNGSITSTQTSTSIVANLLNIMEYSCVAPSPPELTDVPKTFSFSNEWGLAPTDDDVAENVPSHRAISPLSLNETQKSVGKNLTPLIYACKFKGDPANTVLSEPAEQTFALTQLNAAVVTDDVSSVASLASAASISQLKQAANVTTREERSSPNCRRHASSPQKTPVAPIARPDTPVSPSSTPTSTPMHLKNNHARSFQAHENFEMVLEEQPISDTKPRLIWPFGFFKNKKNRMSGSSSLLRSQRKEEQPPRKPVRSTDSPAPRRPLSPPKAILRHTRAARKECNEDDDSQNSSKVSNLSMPKQGHSGRFVRTKKQASRHKMANLMSQQTAPLPTVHEDGSDDESLPSVASFSTGFDSSFSVRVPGLKSPDAFISDKDLLGDEIVEQSSQLNKAKASAVAPAMQKEHLRTKRSKDAAKSDAIEKNGFKELETQERNFDVKNVSYQVNQDPSMIRQSQTWISKLGLSTDKESFSLNKETSKNDKLLDSQTALSRQRSAPIKLTEQEKPITGSPKRLWKAATDPKTGRTYYYHRLTRKTTWTKPPDNEIISPRVKLETNNMTAEINNSGTKPIEGEVQVVFRKLSPRDFDPNIWKTKQDIADILTSMAPPDGSSVERLMAQYEGREDELLVQLRDLKESQPFDEPLHKGVKAVRGIHVQSLPTHSFSSDLESMRNRVRTLTSIVSSNTALASETTQQIKNTAPKAETNQENDSRSTSISSKQGDNLPGNPPCIIAPKKIPSNIPVPRSRELTVEEYSTDRYKAETFDRRGFVRTNMKPYEPLPPRRRRKDVQEDAFLNGDDSLSKSNDSAPADSISALSEPEGLFERHEIHDLARRQALDEAIALGNWDLAAVLSENMRAMSQQTSYHPQHHYHNFNRYEQIGQEWTQSELDRFISENDWDAVAGYIARVRASAHNASIPTQRFFRAQENRSSRTSSPLRRFGARSQLQHTELYSDDSWDSRSASSYESEFTSESSYTDEDRSSRFSRSRSRSRSRGQSRSRNFAC